MADECAGLCMAPSGTPSQTTARLRVTNHSAELSADLDVLAMEATRDTAIGIPTSMFYKRSGRLWCERYS